VQKNAVISAAQQLWFDRIIASDFDNQKGYEKAIYCRIRNIFSQYFDKRIIVNI